MSYITIVLTIIVLLFRITYMYVRKNGSCHEHMSCRPTSTDMLTFYIYILYIVYIRLSCDLCKVV